MTTKLDAQIEPLLFFKSVPVRTKELAALLNVTEEAVLGALDEFEAHLEGRGLQLVRKDSSVLLTTGHAVAPIIERALHEELERDLGKAGLETLTIVLYRSPISRADIDYIRGINSSYILRTLLVRGLVERYTHPNARRSHLYRPTFELLQYLGIGKLEELPEYGTVRERMASFVERGRVEEVAAE